MTEFVTYQAREDQASPRFGLISGPPMARSNESPVTYADRMGAWYVAGRDDEHRKSHGLYLTPEPVAVFMAAMIEPKGEKLRLLDPAAGAGVLLCAAVEHLAAHSKRPRKIELVACEIDADLREPLRLVLDHLSAWAAERGVSVTPVIRQEDFILANAHSLDAKGDELFDAVIANPPYFKINKNDPRAIAAQSLVHGQPNIYALFMAISAAMLKAGGDFVFITPRSFASGPYFRRFRERFFELVRPVRTHVFGSRRETFSRDAVLQENVILHAVRDDAWPTKRGQRPFTISSSSGYLDLADSVEWPAALADVLDAGKPGSVFRLPSSPEDEDILSMVDSWPGSLHGYGLNISTGPVVAFRATEWLVQESNGVTVPLLWLNHIQAMNVRWPHGKRKPQYIVNKAGSSSLLLPNRNYVVLRRFSAKEEHRRMTAAPLLSKDMPGKLIGLENHLNYIYRPDGNLTEDETWGLAALYNSALLDGYFRCSNGNTQVSATELRAMPLPPLATIVAIGRRVKRERDPMAMIDELVRDMTTGEANTLMEEAVG